MSDPVDPAFLKRCDAHIDLSNEQAKLAPGPNVAASMSFATARYNAWLCAKMYGTPEEMKRMREPAIKALKEHYNNMLEDSFNDCINNFHNYVTPGPVSR